MPKNRRVMGIDLAFRATGFAILEKTADPKRPILCREVGLFRLDSPNKKPKNEYMSEFYMRSMIAFSEFMEDVLTVHEFDEIGVEVPSGSKSGRASTQMSLATGAMAAVLYCSRSIMRADYRVFLPGTVKMALTGDKKASKRKCMDAAITLIGGDYKEIGTKCMWTPISKPGSYPAELRTDFNSGEFEHIADAIGVALCVL